MINCKKIQNRATRVLLDASSDSSFESLREILQWKDVRHQLLFDRTVMVFKSLNNLAPAYLCSKFITRNKLVNCPLRDP